MKRIKLLLKWIAIVFVVVFLAGNMVSIYHAFVGYPERTKLVGAFAGAIAWKTPISLCFQEQGDLADTLCGTPGINGIPADIGAGELKYVASITTTAAGVITVTSTAVINDNEKAVIIMTPTRGVSGIIYWELTGNGCSAINC